MDTNELLNSLGNILGNEGGDNKLSGLAKMLTPASDEERGGRGGREDKFSEEMFSYMGRLMESFNRRDNRIDLLNSIRPYLREKRAGNVDMAIRIIRLMNLARDFNFKDVKNVSDI